LKGKLRNIQHSLSSNEIDIIADKTEYFSGIDKNIKNDAIN